MNGQPVAIRREGSDVIIIEWSDGDSTRWTAQKLRDVCPCATCREKRSGGESETAGKTLPTLPVLSAAEARPLSIEAMRPVGNYAYQVVFSDGHDSGIFTFQHLRDQSS